MHRQSRVVHCGGECEVAIGETATAGQQHCASPKIEPFGAHMPARASACRDHHRIRLARGVLLDHDCVGAGWENPSGEDSDGFAGSNASLERMSGRNLADQPEASRHTRNVGSAHSIAIHGRDVGGRLRTQRRDILREHATVGFASGENSAGSGSAPSSTRASASGTGISATTYSIA